MTPLPSLAGGGPSPSPHAEAAVIRRMDLGLTTVFSISGDLDVLAADRLERELRDAAAVPGARVVVDLSDVSFMDSTALHSLVEARRRADDTGASFITRGAEGQPRRLLDIGRAHYGVGL